jgi:hypothetical protein
MNINTIKYKGCTIEISQDEDATSPRENCNVGTMVCWHRRYKLGDEQPKEDPSAYIRSKAWPRLEAWFEAEVAKINFGFTDEQRDDAISELESQRDEDDALALEMFRVDHIDLPLYLMDHSGISMSTGSFGDPWDSGQVGFIYCTKAKALKEIGGLETVLDCATPFEAAYKYLEAEVKTYDHFIEGNVFCYATKDFDDKIIDSCCGFIGYSDDDYMMSQAKESIDAYIEKYGVTVGDASGEHDETEQENDNET